MTHIISKGFYNNTTVQLSTAGGDLNRTVYVRFSTDTKEVLTIRQTIKGQEALGFLRMTTTVSGKMPKIAKGAKVQVDDYKDEYKREGTGSSITSTTKKPIPYNTISLYH